MAMLRCAVAVTPLSGSAVPLRLVKIAAVVAEHAVVAGAAGDPVVAPAADEVVVAGVAEDHVVAAAGVDGVVAGLAVDLVGAPDVDRLAPYVAARFWRHARGTGRAAVGAARGVVEQRDRAGQQARIGSP